MSPILQAITFHPLTSRDLPMLTRWLAEPHVRRFYQKTPVTLDDVIAESGPALRGEEPSLRHLAVSGGVPFAYLQCHRNADYPKWCAIIGVDDGFSIDLFIGDPAFLHRGFGRAALRAYLDDVAFPAYPDERRAYIAHELINTAALNCSEAAGFRRLRSFVEDGNAMMLLAIERRGGARLLREA